jgi:streptogramin lyase
MQPMYLTRTNYFVLVLKALLGAWGLLFFNIVSAQTIQFKNYSVKDGLPSSEVYNVMQDSKGYMWFGTDEGACRFDGYEFKVFNTANGLPDKNIFEILEDYKGRIWFRSYSGKLSYYYNDSIYCLPINDKLVQLRKNARMTSMAFDSSDNIYVGFLGYIKPLKISIKDNYAISSIPISSDYHSYICQTPSKGIITGFYTKNDSMTHQPLLLKSTAVILKLYRINKGNKITSKLLYPYNENGNQIHNKTIQLPDGSILTTLLSRFLTLDKTDSITLLKKLQGTILNIIPGAKNDACIITTDSAPLYYTHGKIIQNKSLQFLKSKFITSMTIDAEGGYWFTSINNGVYYSKSLEYKIWTTENGLPSNKLTLLKSGPDSCLWISTIGNSKIALLYKDSIAYRTIPDFKYYSVDDILFRPDKTIWISTTTGIYIFDNQKSFHVLCKAKELGRDMAENGDGRVWLSFINSIGLLKYQLNSISVEDNIPLHSEILRLTKGNDGLWLGTFNDLVKYSDGTLTSLSNFNPVFKTEISDVKQINNNIWTATRNGIIIKSKEKILHLTTNNGLISNFCKCICTDDKGEVWVGTSNGVSCVIPGKNSTGDFNISAIRNLHSPNLSEVNQIVCIGNMVYAGTNNGLTAFNMNKILPDTVPPPIYITKVKINDKYISATNTQGTYPYDENYIVLNYAGLTYTNAGMVSYRYKMQGIDTGWIYTKSTSAQYPKLQPGSYTFLVSAMNEDGIWNEHPASFHFIINPPFWNTWWAISIFAIIILLIIFWQFKALSKREKRKAAIDKLMTLSELRELKKQVDPHFLFNNLNTLLNLVQSKPEIAPEFIEKLADFYRYTIDNKNSEFTDLKTEIEQGERYTKLLQIRFGKEFEVKWNINKRHLEYLIPTFALQLLIENITKHNAILSGTPIDVEITSTEDNILIVKNQVIQKLGMKESTGTGLKSIDQRYRLLLSKQIKIIHTHEHFVVELPLISPVEYESIDN